MSEGSERTPPGDETSRKKINLIYILKEQSLSAVTQYRQISVLNVDGKIVNEERFQRSANALNMPQ